MKKVLTLVALAVALLGAGTVGADQIFVQHSGTSAAGGDPNLITNTGSFVVGVAGSATMTNPMLIIVGVYDGNGVPSISFPGGVSTAALGTYGLTGNTAVSFTSGDAYTALGLTPETNSESFGNWSGGDTAHGLAAPTSFSLYAFALNTSLSGTTSIDESGAASGSFIIAFDCKSGSATSSGCSSHGDIGDTPITNAGLLDATPTPTPEPGSLALLSTGLLSLGGALRRRFMKA